MNVSTCESCRPREDGNATRAISRATSCPDDPLKQTSTTLSVRSRVSSTNWPPLPSPMQLIWSRATVVLVVADFESRQSPGSRMWTVYCPGCRTWFVNRRQIKVVICIIKRVRRVRIVCSLERENGARTHCPGGGRCAPVMRLRCSTVS